MRRGLWVGAAVLLALVAAIPLWLALDGDGERRAAALQEPTSSGDVATLTLTSAASGTLAIPVQSFSLSMTSPRDAASGMATGQPRYGPLRILKQVDASSPALFKMVVNNEGITAATLETKDSLGRSVLSYSFTNARVSRWQDGKREELEIHYEEMTSSVGTLPKGGTAGIGVMSAPTLGAGKVSIQDFLTGVVSPTEAATGLASGKRQHKPVMVLRSLHPTWPMLHTKIRNNQTLGDITIELQRPNSSGILETYATYLYSNAQAASVEDSAATGVLPSQKLEFVYQSVQVTVDKKTETDDWAAPVAG